MDKHIATIYRNMRRFSVDRVYGVHPNQPRAGACLRMARQRAEFDDSFDLEGDAYVSNDGRVRLRIVADEHPYDPGDMFDVKAHASTVPGGERAIRAQEKAFWSRIERDGVWGFIVERRCAACGHWEHVDSCWGFDDRECCLGESIPCALDAVK